VNGGDHLRPLYIGRTGRLGKKGGISANISGLPRDRAHFARWGHGRYYHIGDLRLLHENMFPT